MKLWCETDCPALEICHSARKQARRKLHDAAAANTGMIKLQALKRSGLIELVDRNPDRFDTGDQTTGQFLYGVLAAMKREKRYNRGIMVEQDTWVSLADHARFQSTVCHGPEAVRVEDRSARHRSVWEIECGEHGIEMAADLLSAEVSEFPEPPNSPMMQERIGQLIDAQRWEDIRAGVEALRAVPA